MDMSPRNSNLLAAGAGSSEIYIWNISFSKWNPHSASDSASFLLTPDLLRVTSQYPVVSRPFEMKGMSFPNLVTYECPPIPNPSDVTVVWRQIKGKVTSLRWFPMDESSHVKLTSLHYI